MAQIADPRKQFNFRVTVQGLNQFLVQDISVPEESADVVEHGDFNFLVKTGGIKKIGKIVLEKISVATAPDNWLATWMQMVQNTTVGGGLLPSIYKKTVQIDQLAPDNISVINTYLCLGVWPSKRNSIEFKRTGSENTMEKLELEVDEIIQS